MEPPGPPIKRSRWDFFGKPIVIALSIILILAVFFLILVYITQEPYQYPYLAAPTGAFQEEYEMSTDTYRLTVISLSDEIIELDEIYFNLRNNRIEVEHDLPAILNNENSNITFYDIDNDGIYSVGDEFYIDGDIVEPETDFHVIWSRNGKYIMGFDFEE